MARVSWMFGGKRYYGTLIRETKTHKFARTENGKVKKVMFGDPNMPVRKNNPKARASFRARHKCSTAKDKTTARYWACRDW